MVSAKFIATALALAAPLVSAAPSPRREKMDRTGNGNSKFILAYCEYDRPTPVPGFDTCQMVGIFSTPGNTDVQVVKTSISHTSMTCGAMKKYRSHKNDEGFKFNLETDRKVELTFNGKKIESFYPEIIENDTKVLQNICERTGSDRERGLLNKNSFAYEYHELKNIL